MKVLIIGSGGREHALAWKVAQSPRLSRLYIAPGNAGTAQCGENVPVPTEDNAAILAFTRENKVDLVLVGPEAPLAAGLADDLRAAGVPVFGPSRAAAQIEASKAIAKDFMARHGIPTARYATFTGFGAALAHLRSVDYPVVIKASGLAAGKGVLVPENSAQAEAALRAVLLDRQFGPAGDQAIIEERLAGEEVSLLSFTDGQTLKPMPPAQDHKRLLDGDLGPNTGGMGVYAPASICPPDLVAGLTETVVQPTVDGLRSEGRPYVGVLYAGMILTDDGPQVLEYNCRFGDPEAQVILPLLESDLLDIVEACITGCLSEADVRWAQGAAACVVLASEGYPGECARGRAIRGLDETLEGALVFHAGTKADGEQVVTAGGRVLGVTGLGDSLQGALEAAYAAIDKISFEGMQYRKDIGYRAIVRSP